MNQTKTRLTILSMIILAALCVAYAQRLRLEAWVWHLRHGETLVVAGYFIPVPAKWYVMNRGEIDNLLVRIDTDDPAALKRLKIHASISVRVADPIKGFVSTKEDWLQKQTTRPLSLRTFNFDGDTMLCSGGKKLDSGGIPDVEPVGWNCRADGGLEMTILATDPDMPQVWEIVSGIRRKS